MDLKNYTTQELKDLQQAIYREKSKRRNAEYKKTNKCPECYGTGFVVGSLSCVRCKATGKYISEISIKPHPTLKGKTVVEKDGEIIGAQG